MRVSYRIAVPITVDSDIPKFRKTIREFLDSEFGEPRHEWQIDIVDIDGKSYEDYALDNAGLTNPVENGENPYSKVSEHGEPTVADVLHFVSLPAKQVAEIYTWETIGKYADIWNRWTNG